MKILLANKFYYPRGGDCTYLLNIEELLESHGHETAVFAMQYPENIPSPWSGYFPSEIKFTPGLKMLEAFFRPFGTGEVKRKFTKLLDDFRPDIVHLGNIHTQLSPVLAKIAHGKGIKVVWTLHDYKLLCPRYDCLRNGEIPCEACFSDKHKVLEYKCMKNSRIASYIAYREALKWPREKLENYTDAFISPSRFLKDKMVQGGFAKDKIHTCCNFINTAKVRRENYDKDDYYCYVGRLSHEKGIGTLIEAAKGLPLKLKIIGNGPLQEILTAQAAGADIELLGYRQWDEIKEIVGNMRSCALKTVVLPCGSSFLISCPNAPDWRIPSLTRKSMATVIMPLLLNPSSISCQDSCAKEQYHHREKHHSRTHLVQNQGYHHAQQR